MPGRTVDHQGRRTAYRINASDGHDGSVVCIHGPAWTSAVWDHQFQLATERPVAALDLSGHGESEDITATPGWETLAAYASDVSRVCEELSGRFLVGHALGAAVALHVVCRRSVPLDGVVLIGIGTRLPVNEDILDMARHDFEGLVEFLHSRGGVIREPSSDAANTSKQAMRANNQTIAERDYDTCHHLTFGSLLEDVDVPTFVLCGEFDPITPPDANKAVRDRLRLGSFEEIEGAAHLPMLERPDATNDHLSRFFANPGATVAPES